MYAVVEISFYKMVGHLSLIPWVLWSTRLGPSGEILKIWPVQITQNCYLRLFQIFILTSAAASNWWLWIWVHGKMYMKNISVSIAFKVFFFVTRIKIFMSPMQLKPCLKQLNRVHTWGYHHAVNLYRRDCSRCSVQRKLKI